MSTLMIIGCIGTLCYLLVQFARQEHIQDDYEDTILEVEGRLEWARSRTRVPFGMAAQLEVCGELLGKAKKLWEEHRWDQAYYVSRQSQEAMNRAQSLYISAIKARP